MVQIHLFRLFAVLLFLTFKVAAQTTMNDVDQILKSKKPKTIEEFISLLPNELKESAVFIKNSGSLQAASIESPRVILKSNSGDVLISFNGSENQRGGSSVEVMSYDSKNKSYTLREITFKNGQHSISKNNPDKCIQCHTKDPRPIWQGYIGPGRSFWIGTYAEDEHISPEEKAEFDRFLGKALTHPRYKHLNIKKPVDDVREYYDLLKGKSVDMSEAIGMNILDRMSDRIKKTQDYDKYKYAILGMSGCPPQTFKPSSFFPSNHKLSQLDYEKHNENYYKPAYQNIRMMMESRGIDTSSWFPESPTNKNLEYGTPTNNSGVLSYGLATGDSDLQPYIVSTRHNRYKEKDSMIAELYDYKPDESGMYKKIDQCENLRQKSLSVLTKDLETTLVCDTPKILGQNEKTINEIADFVDLVKSGKEITLRSCIHCHSKEGGIYIPFEDEKELKKWLFKDRKFDLIMSLIESREMPLDRKLSDDEVNKLKKYIENFK